MSVITTLDALLELLFIVMIRDFFDRYCESVPADAGQKEGDAMHESAVHHRPADCLIFRG